MAEFLASLFSSVHVAIGLLVCILLGVAWVGRRLFGKKGIVETLGRDGLNAMKNLINTKIELAGVKGELQGLRGDVTEVKAELREVRQNDLPHLGERVSAVEAKLSK